MSTNTERKIRDVRDVWGGCGGGGMQEDSKDNMQKIENGNENNRTKHKYKTLERHLSMKKTIRKKMMRDLREIGDASSTEAQNQGGFLEQIRTDQPPSANVDKPSLWKRLTKGWGHS